MDISIFDLIKGIIIGIIISLPLGPVALITMKRTAEFGLRAGILSGLAIVLIDTTATVIILLGVHHSLPYFNHLPLWLLIAGALGVFFYGLRMIYTDPIPAITNDLPWHKHFLMSAIITLTNPSTYFSFGIIALLLSKFIGQPLFARVTVGVGFFIGALLWWCTLAYIAFSQRDRYHSASNMHRAVGVVIMFLAILILLPIRVPHYLQLIPR